MTPSPSAWAESRHRARRRPREPRPHQGAIRKNTAKGTPSPERPPGPTHMVAYRRTGATTAQIVARGTPPHGRARRSQRTRTGRRTCGRPDGTTTHITRQWFWQQSRFQEDPREGHPPQLLRWHWIGSVDLVWLGGRAGFIHLMGSWPRLHTSPSETPPGSSEPGKFSGRWPTGGGRPHTPPRPIGLDDRALRCGTTMPRFLTNPGGRTWVGQSWRAEIYWLLWVRQRNRVQDPAQTSWISRWESGHGTRRSWLLCQKTGRQRSHGRLTGPGPHQPTEAMVDAHWLEPPEIQPHHRTQVEVGQIAEILQAHPGWTTTRRITHAAGRSEASPGCGRPQSPPSLPDNPSTLRGASSAETDEGDNRTGTEGTVAQWRPHVRPLAICWGSHAEVSRWAASRSSCHSQRAVSPTAHQLHRGGWSDRQVATPTAGKRVASRHSPVHDDAGPADGDDYITSRGAT